MYVFGPPFLEPSGDRKLGGVVYEEFCIANPITSNDFSHLLGKGKVSIDGVEREVVAVDRFSHFPPWHRGESLGLICVKV